MKKILYLTLSILILTGCSKKLDNNIKINDKKETEVVEDKDLEPIKEIYIDNNPIKIAFYKKSDGKYKRLDKFSSKEESMKEIGIFSIVLDNEEEVIGNSIKSLYNEYKENIQDFDNYKIGYNIKFTLKDGTIINDNILKPMIYNGYSFGSYIYVWLYDDINTSGWHSHIEEDKYNDNTIMSSIKLMWGHMSSEIDSDIELTVFTYDSDDFDENGNYRGISKFTTVIERI